MLELESHTENQKYRDYIQPLNQDVFAVLDPRIVKTIPDWHKRVILDFGCNIGGLYKTAAGRILPERYHGVDIYAPAIETARRQHPETNWYHYDRFQATFNPTGIPGLAPPVLPEAPEIIIAYGVFTHMDWREIQHWMNYFRSILAPGGVIVVSLWESIQFPGYMAFLKRQFGISLKLAPYGYDRSCYLVNRAVLELDSDVLGRPQVGPEPSPPDHCSETYEWVEAFYKRRFILQQWPGATVPEGPFSLHTVYVVQ